VPTWGSPVGEGAMRTRMGRVSGAAVGSNVIRLRDLC
jgi:hypothetical protein